jgi:hypothetical protein
LLKLDKVSELAIVSAQQGEQTGLFQLNKVIASWLFIA